MAGLYLHPLLYSSNKGAFRVVSEDPTLTTMGVIWFPADCPLYILKIFTFPFLNDTSSRRRGIQVFRSFQQIEKLINL